MNLFFYRFSSPFAVLLSHVTAMMATARAGAACDWMSHWYGRSPLFLGGWALQKISKKSEEKLPLRLIGTSPGPLEVADAHICTLQSNGLKPLPDTGRQVGIGCGAAAFDGQRTPQFAINALGERIGCAKYHGAVPKGCFVIEHQYRITEEPRRAHK